MPARITNLPQELIQQILRKNNLCSFRQTSSSMRVATNRKFITTIFDKLLNKMNSAINRINNPNTNNENLFYMGGQQANLVYREGIAAKRMVQNVKNSKWRYLKSENRKGAVKYVNNEYTKLTAAGLN